MGDLVCGLGFCGFPGRGEARGAKDHAFFGPGEDFQVTADFGIWFFCEQADFEAEVLVFFEQRFLFFFERLQLGGVQIEFIAQVFAVASEFVGGFEVSPGGEHEEEEAEGEAPGKGRFGDRDPVHRGRRGCHKLVVCRRKRPIRRLLSGFKRNYPIELLFL